MARKKKDVTFYGPPSKLKKPPNNWSHAGTIKFYEKYGPSVDDMKKFIKSWYGPYDPGAMAAAIADYARGTTYWRSKMRNNQWYCIECGKLLEEKDRHNLDGINYCMKHFAIKDGEKRREGEAA